MACLQSLLNSSKICDSRALRLLLQRFTFTAATVYVYCCNGLRLLLQRLTFTATTPYVYCYDTLSFKALAPWIYASLCQSLLIQ